MTIEGQINVCLHNLNVLHDMVSARRPEDFDLDWQLDQIEKAKICIEKLKDGESE